MMIISLSSWVVLLLCISSHWARALGDLSQDTQSNRTLLRRDTVKFSERFTSTDGAGSCKNKYEILDLWIPQLALLHQTVVNSLINYDTDQNLRILWRSWLGIPLPDSGNILQSQWSDALLRMRKELMFTDGPGIQQGAEMQIYVSEMREHVDRITALLTDDDVLRILVLCDDEAKFLEEITWDTPVLDWQGDEIAPLLEDTGVIPLKDAYHSQQRDGTTPYFFKELNTYDFFSTGVPPKDRCKTDLIWPMKWNPSFQSLQGDGVYLGERDDGIVICLKAIHTTPDVWDTLQELTSYSKYPEFLEEPQFPATLPAWMQFYGILNDVVDPEWPGPDRLDRQIPYFQPSPKGTPQAEPPEWEDDMLESDFSDDAMTGDLDDDVTDETDETVEDVEAHEGDVEGDEEGNVELSEILPSSNQGDEDSEESEDTLGAKETLTYTHGTALANLGYAVYLYQNPPTTPSGEEPKPAVLYDGHMMKVPFYPIRRIVNNGFSGLSRAMDEMVSKLPTEGSAT